MGSDDDTRGTDPVPVEQKPEGSSAAKTPPSDGSGGADESGASSPSARRQQPKHVQNLCDDFTDGPIRPDDNLIAKTKVPDVKELQLRR